MFMSYFAVLALCSITRATIIDLRSGKYFRSDYVFNIEANGWIKLHEVPSTWNEARLRCHLEGSILASPSNPKIMKAMIKHIKERSSEVFTGINAVNSKGDFYSVEGVPLRKIPVDWAPQEPNNYLNKEQCIIMYKDGTIGDVNCEDTFPYICYKPYIVSELTFSPTCGTVDPDYRYSDVTGHCYKFHTLGQTWTRAFMTCSAEGGYLAIINSKEEAKLLSSIFDKYTHQMIMAGYKDIIRIGVKAEVDTFDWMTIHGQTLAEAGYENWNIGEPNSNYRQSCAAMNRDGTLDDIRCDPHVPFICEKSPESLSI